MKNTDCRRLIVHARLLHTDLRDCRRTVESQANRIALCEAVINKLGSVRCEVKGSGGEKFDSVVFRRVDELILDAMCHAGIRESGFLPLDGYDDRYEFLLDVAQNLHDPA